MSKRAVRSIRALTHGPMETIDPFLFCVYHKDAYPAGNEKMEIPNKSGNGADFNPSAPYRFYHGKNIPGFPQHPHRGFETITATIDGIIDHADSKGNAGRYGFGDLQWMHAGEGVVHGEMFPMLNTDKPNHTRFFQIWINLPSNQKMTKPDFEMHWAHQIKKWEAPDGNAKVTIWAGSFGGVETDCPAPSNSWAADKGNDVSILHITLKQSGEIELQPSKNPKSKRALYFIEGETITIEGRDVKRANPGTLIELDSSATVKIRARDDPCEILLLQGVPIGEPVAQHGPFVMNTQQEIQQAFRDYQQTQFGGWPWNEDAYVCPRNKGRFSLLDGKEDHPPKTEHGI